MGTSFSSLTRETFAKPASTRSNSFESLDDDEEEIFLQGKERVLTDPMLLFMIALTFI